MGIKFKIAIGTTIIGIACIIFDRAQTVWEESIGEAVQAELSRVAEVERKEKAHDDYLSKRRDFWMACNEDPDIESSRYVVVMLHSNRRYRACLVDPYDSELVEYIKATEEVKDWRPEYD